MRILSACIFFLFYIPKVDAQKFGYFDSRVVLKSVSGFQEAQKEIDKKADSFKSELDKKYQSVDKLRKEFSNRELLLKPYERQKMLGEILELEKEIESFKQDKFGYEGELFLERQALIESNKEEVFKRITSVCKKNRLEFLFDKASGIVIIYANPIHNYTELVAKALEPKEEEEEEEAQYGQKEEFKPEPAEHAGYIDSEYILKAMPEYQDVLNEMKNFEGMWQRHFDSLTLQLDSLDDAFKKDEVYLTTEMKSIRLKEIEEKEGEVRQFQIEKYGPEGEVFTKRLDLIKPLQEKIYEVTEELAQEKNVHFIFDKTDDRAMMYVNPVYNYSDYVLEKMELGDQEDVIR
ncbi:MAG: OmpH family outer membrane protein [Bacteroidota bacterium]